MLMFVLYNVFISMQDKMRARKRLRKRQRSVTWEIDHSMYLLLNLWICPKLKKKKKNGLQTVNVSYMVFRSCSLFKHANFVLRLSQKWNGIIEADIFCSRPLRCYSGNETCGGVVFNLQCSSFSNGMALDVWRNGSVQWVLLMQPARQKASGGGVGGGCAAQGAMCVLFASV